MRRWRKDYQGNLWTKGSRASCFGRFFCCTIMIFLFFLISIVLSLALVSLTLLWSACCGVRQGSSHLVPVAPPTQYHHRAADTRSQHVQCERN